MRSRSALVLAVTLLVPILSAGSCRKTQPVTPEAAAPPAQKATPVEPPGSGTKREVTESFPTQPIASAPLSAESSVEELNRKKVLQTVYFDYDKSDLLDSARETLQANADWLKANRGRTVRIEGHCDERGTIEYNLALGQRRAASVRSYLEGLGIAPDRLETVSFGKERPEDPGHDESAHSRNRRAEFVIKS
jgi:peptidoglycan-associated lipoprotein